MKVHEKCFCATPFVLTAENQMKFQQLQNLHAAKYNRIRMHTNDTTCPVQESLTKFPRRGQRLERDGWSVCTLYDRMPGGVIVGDSGLCCCVPVQCMTSMVRAQLLPFVC